ncbi:MAG: isoprenylcysteine carboxylmethyltransferase family protein [Candidatus Bathyarchaeota archaeon]|nr:isoprenylcysteine carboxylmethyltransferase family protein [Candidatus Bathyarchaeota archaeon]
MVPLHFMSVEHLSLQRRYGAEKGRRIGEILGLVSGWGFFSFWVGLWLSPQPRFTIPYLQAPSIHVPSVDFTVPMAHLLVSLPFLLSGVWLGIGGLREVTLRVAETHRAERVVTTGVYSIVRHPQYLGGLLAHVGASFLLSAWFSLASTPLMVLLNYLISRKEEEELVREFGEDYEEYRGRVSMFIPRLRRPVNTAK